MPQQPPTRHSTLISMAMFFSALSAQFFGSLWAVEESLPGIGDRPVPQDLAGLWAGYDPTAEPLETQVLKEWEEDGVVLRQVRFLVGVFKGKPAFLAGIYGFPKDSGRVPGLLQIHGGGQSAHKNAVITNGQRGYATLSIAWAGRVDGHPGRVDGKEPSPTEWGALDAYHAPCRNAGNTNWQDIKPAPWTLEDRPSPRNSNWFVVALAGRRALTFLAQQPEVDADRLGVYGHSMGGKLTVLVAASDPRVKAAAPSCGGISNLSDDGTPLGKSMADGASLAAIHCPIIFLSPANDFHGRFVNLPQAIAGVGANPWRIVSAPHHNHQDNAEAQVTGLLWMDQYLKGTFTYPATPATDLVLAGPKGVPVLTITPDPASSYLGVETYYTQQVRDDGKPEDRDEVVARFWHHAPARKQGSAWTADLSLIDPGKPLWVYANVRYALAAPTVGAGYYYSRYTAKQYILSSLPRLIPAAELAKAGVKTTTGTSLEIESFADGWQREWFTYSPESWARSTHKVHHPRWAAPAGAALGLEIRSAEANQVVIRLETDHGQFGAVVSVPGGASWQRVKLTPGEFKNAAQEPLATWVGLRDLRLGFDEHLKGPATTPEVHLGGTWKGEPPTFRNLRWLP